MKKFFVSGIGTDVGKTLVAAVLTEALCADYWKPLQSGSLDYPDSAVVKDWVSNSVTKIHTEAYSFTQPLSPHTAAAIDGVEVFFDNIKAPATNNHLIIEGSGGLMVPIDAKYCVIDLIKALDVPVILVSANYLGSINHTLLSLIALEKYKIPVVGIIFNGPSNASGEQAILDRFPLKVLGRIPRLEVVNKDVVAELAAEFKDVLATL